jgi:hypothetical protein
MDAFSYLFCGPYPSPSLPFQLTFQLGHPQPTIYFGHLPSDFLTIIPFELASYKIGILVVAIIL